MRYLILAILLMLPNISYTETVRVVYRVDGGVSIIIPAKSDHTINDFNATMDKDPSLKGMPYDDIDSSQLPYDENGKFKDRQYWTGEKGKGVKIDEAKKSADKIVKENKEKILNDKLKAIGITREELKEAIK